MAAVAAISVAPLATAAPAAPQFEGSSFGQMSSQLTPGAFLGMTEEQAWAKRAELRKQIDSLNNPQIAPSLYSALDGAINIAYPGLFQRKADEERAAREKAAAEKAAAERAAADKAARERAAAEAAARERAAREAANRFNTGPCPKDADVCVDIDGRRTWLQDDNGNVSYVAPTMAPGRPGPATETPRGTFWVTYKIKDEISREFGNAPMPYAVYFTNNGHAFHMGNPAYLSAGCVRLPEQAAIRYFNDLQPGDKVFIY